MSARKSSSAARRAALLALICTATATSVALLVAAGPPPTPPPYNSEEHQLIVDRGAALVNIPAGVTLPPGVSLAATTKPAYREMVRSAKRLAVGIDGNNEAAYSQSTPKVQDNCYWTGYAQRADNLKMHVPDDAQVPDKVLQIPGATNGSSTTAFTLGQLAAVYGDYRRTTHCEGGLCFLNNFDVPKVGFNGNIVREGTFCPDSVTAGAYLQRIGSGLNPPSGGLGNQISNSVGPNRLSDASWYGDEMLRIANVNDWHFSSGAIAWYTGMHRLALAYVDSARSNPVHWVRALHYEANALHSLTDLFAFGHVVTNRDETSYGIMKANSLLANKGYLWQQNVLAMGGATRSGSGRISLSGALPTPLTNLATDRNDYVNSYRSDWWARAKAEHTYHSEFNETGAQVRNLNGDVFQIFGDKRLNQMVMTGTSLPVLIQAVRASVQSLFDAHVALGAGTITQQSIGAAGTPYFAALKYVPVYIASDANRYFTGRWTLYAKAVDDLTGVGKVPSGWESCAVKYLSGADWAWPAKTDAACAAF